MALVEDHAGRLVLRIVGRARLLVSLQRRLYFWRKLGPQAIRLGQEVRERGCRVRQHERFQPRWVCERVLLSQKAAPGGAEHVMPVGDPERVYEVVEVADEQRDRPEIGAAVGLVRAPAVADLVVEDDRAAVLR